MHQNGHDFEMVGKIQHFCREAPEICERGFSGKWPETLYVNYRIWRRSAESQGSLPINWFPRIKNELRPSKIVNRHLKIWLDVVARRLDHYASRKRENWNVNVFPRILHDSFTWINEKKLKEQRFDHCLNRLPCCVLKFWFLRLF